MDKRENSAGSGRSQPTNNREIGGRPGVGVQEREKGAVPRGGTGGRSGTAIGGVEGKSDNLNRPRSSGKSLLEMTEEEMFEMALRISMEAVVADPVPPPADEVEHDLSALSLQDYIAMRSDGGSKPVDGKSGNLSRPIRLRYLPTFIPGLRPLTVLSESDILSVLQLPLLSGRDECCFNTTRIHCPANLRQIPVGNLPDVLLWSCHLHATSFGHITHMLAALFLQLKDISHKDLLFLLTGPVLEGYSYHQLAFSIKTKKTRTQSTFPFEFTDSVTLDTYNWQPILAMLRDSTPMITEYAGPSLLPDDPAKYAWLVNVTFTNYDASGAAGGDFVLSMEVSSGWTDLFLLQVSLSANSAQQYSLVMEPNEMTSFMTGISAWQTSWLGIPTGQIYVDIQILRGVLPPVPQPPAATPVQVVNTNPLWVSDVYVPPTPLEQAVKRADPTPKDYLKVAVLIRKHGPDHAPMFYVTTMNANDQLEGCGYNKKQATNMLATQLKKLYPGRTFSWTECSTVKEWEAALHNRQMHALNGNLATTVSGKAMRTRKNRLAHIERLTKEKMEDHKPGDPSDKTGMFPRTPELKAELEAMKDEIEQTHGTVPWQDLWEALEDMKSNDGVHVRVTVGQALIYSCMAANDVASEFFDELQAQVCKINELMRILEPDEREMTPLSPEDLNVPKPPEKKKPSTRPYDGSRPPRPVAKKDETSPPPKTPVQLENERAAAARRIAKGLAADWTALLWLRNYPGSRDFKKRVWHDYTGNEGIYALGLLFLEQAHVQVYNHFMHETKWENLGIRLDLHLDLLPVETVREEEVNAWNKYMHAITGNIIWAVDAARHNREMHALNGNTNTFLNGRLDLQKIMAMGPDPAAPEIAMGDVLAHISRGPGIATSQHLYLRESLSQWYNPVDTDGTTSSAVAQNLPVFEFYNPWNLDGEVDPDGEIFTGPITVVSCMRAKTPDTLELTMPGKNLLDRMVTGNFMLQKGDVHTINGFYANDMLPVLQQPPYWSLTLEQFALKLICMHKLITTNRLAFRDYVDNADNYQPTRLVFDMLSTRPRFEISHNNWALPKLNSELNGSPVFPMTGTSGGMFLHVTTLTVPPDEPYYFFPLSMAKHKYANAFLALFCTMLSPWPMSSMKVVANTKYPDGASQNGRPFYWGTGRTFIPGETTLNIILPTRGFQSPPTNDTTLASIMLFNPRSGKVDVDDLVANSLLKPLYFGENDDNIVNSEIPLCQYLLSWWIYYNDIDPQLTLHMWTEFVGLVNALSPIYDTIKRMIPVFQACAFSTNTMYAETKDGEAWPNVEEDNSVEHYLDILLLSPKQLWVPPPDDDLQYFSLTAGDYFDSYVIHATDSKAWNCVATGMYSAGKGAINTQLQAEMFTPTWHVSLMAACVPYICAAQLYYMGLGLSVEDINVSYMGVDGKWVYAEELRSFFNSRELVGEALTVTRGGNIMPTYLSQVVGWNTPKWNNGNGDLTIYDRILGTTEPLVVGWLALPVPEDEDRTSRRKFADEYKRAPPRATIVDGHKRHNMCNPIPTEDKDTKKAKKKKKNDKKDDKSTGKKSGRDSGYVSVHEDTGRDTDFLITLPQSSDDEKDPKKTPGPPDEGDTPKPPDKSSKTSKTSKEKVEPTWKKKVAAVEWQYMEKYIPGTLTTAQLEMFCKKMVVAASLLPPTYSSVGITGNPLPFTQETNTNTLLYPLMSDVWRNPLEPDWKMVTLDDATLFNFRIRWQFYFDNNTGLMTLPPLHAKFNGVTLMPLDRYPRTLDRYVEEGIVQANWGLIPYRNINSELLYVMTSTDGVKINWRQVDLGMTNIIVATLKYNRMEVNRGPLRGIPKPVEPRYQPRLGQKKELAPAPEAPGSGPRGDLNT